MKWTLMSKTGLTDRANSDKVGEIKVRKSQKVFSNSPNYITNSKYFTIDSPMVSDFVRFFEDRANSKRPAEILPPLPL